MTAANEPTGAPVSPSVESPTPPESITIQAVPPTPTTATVVQESSAPAKEPVTPERFAARLRRLDVVAAGLVLVLAFFLGSFAAHNSDFWQHLALGRLVAHGQYHFGEDPFAYSIQDSGAALWTNASWLFDWALYQVGAAPDGGLPALGGAPIIILKALLIVLLAGLMIRIRRAGSSAWIPLCLTALGLVVMMPRLLLQPTIVSFLLLGLTLYLLQAPGSAASDK
ncbi:MAG TPA: hypothetical protein VFA18_01655, partial [Gemmataceae bacterium]|nr:hypothetical protein [Gemmataceae bacterium]